MSLMTGIVNTILSFLTNAKKRKSPLNTELENLYKSIEKTDVYLYDLEQRFWENGGICCPSCGSKEYRHLVEKQKRRRRRVEALKKKLSL
jgi:4-hydroxy-3-methylbut-2-en-1-yl diphosphate synthase IspG/GcpE